MSIRLMSAVWVLPITPAPKLVLLALADWANDGGRQCFPSIRSIAARACISERQAQRHMRALEAAGWLSVSGAEAGGATSRRYRLAAARMYAALAEVEAAKAVGRETDGRGDTSVTGDVHVTGGVTLKSQRGDTSVTRSTSNRQVAASSSKRALARVREQPAPASPLAKGRGKKRGSAGLSVVVDGVLVFGSVERERLESARAALPKEAFAAIPKPCYLSAVERAAALHNRTISAGPGAPSSTNTKPPPGEPGTQEWVDAMAELSRRRAAIELGLQP